MPRPKGTVKPEWSYLLDVSELDGPENITIEAGEEECAALARRLNIPALQALGADFTISREPGDIAFHVSGMLEARVVQDCVITLEPLEQHIREPVEGWFGDKSKTVSFVQAKKDRQVRKSHAEVEVLEEREDPEALVNGCIDLGEFVAQHLSLALNPYPHAPGAHYDLGDDAEGQMKLSEGRKSPFEALKEWKERR
jgi:uncharacterized metal-binding protein YceD (DUF177 family)